MVRFTVDDVPDLSGKICFITGGNTGLGKESVLAFARKGAKVYMAARTKCKALAAIQDIKSRVPSAEVQHIPLDLTSFASIKNAVDAFTAQEDSLHVLLNNAGIMMTPYSTTAEGYEIQWGTNHMGHFLLTKLLLPTLEKTAKMAPEGDVRIVNLSSMGHAMARNGIPFDELQMEKAYTWDRYGVAKLANICHARELARRYTASTGIIAVSCHPGVIYSDLYTPFAQSSFLVKLSFELFKYVSKSVKDGALNQIYLSTSPQLTAADSGEFFLPIGVKNCSLLWGASKYAKDAKLAEKLWEYSEEEVKKHGY